MSNAILDTNDVPIRFDFWLGRVEVETRMRPEGNRLIGEGRSREYDGDGKLIRETPWTPTGVVCWWPAIT